MYIADCVTGQIVRSNQLLGDFIYYYFIYIHILF